MLIKCWIYFGEVVNSWFGSNWYKGVGMSNENIEVVGVFVVIEKYKDGVEDVEDFFLLYLYKMD